MTVLLILASWTAAALAAGMVLGLAITIADQAQDHLFDDDQADGDTDLLLGQPVDILGPREVDARFAQIVAGLERRAR